MIGDKTTLLCLQNGLGTEEIASDIIKNPLRGVTSNGSLLLKNGFIAHTGRGDTILGERDGIITQKMKMIADAFTKAGLNTRITENIQGVVWTKTLVNSGINPFGALTRMKNGELVQVSSLKELMVRTVREGINVAEKIGIT